MTDANDSVQCSLLYLKFKPGDAIDASPAVHFQDVVPQDDLKDDWSPCSHNTLISDRKVYKISFYHQPMMREEQINCCTSSGALYTVALHPEEGQATKTYPGAAKENLFQKTRSSVFKERGAQGR